MNQTVLFELEHSKKRLEYYNQRKAATKSKSIDKWVEIYAERVKKLERQVTKLGLRTEISVSGATVAPATSTRKRA